MSVTPRSPNFIADYLAGLARGADQVNPGSTNWDIEERDLFLDDIGNSPQGEIRS